MIKLRSAVTLVAALLLILPPSDLAAHKNHEQKTADAVILAPGYQALNFPAPVPGTYDLPVIKAAADGEVVTHKQENTSLFELLEGRVGILSYIYTSCDDVNGCPLASFVLSKIDKRIQQDPALRDAVRLLSVSFDYETDTPETLAEYAKSFARNESDWRFVRAASKNGLQSLLNAYDQSVVVEPDGSTLSHILRVFLIDTQRRIRNVYSVSFLHADTLVADIRTILAEAQTAPAPMSVSKTIAPREPSTAPAQSSRALKYDDHTGIDLYDFSKRAQLGLPTPNAVATAPEIALGKRLFFDRRLSHNDTISCAMCHIPEQGFTSNELTTAVGIEGRTVRRNSPSLLNVGFMQKLFHDGRESSLEQQVWSPLLAFNEMANPSIGHLINKISKIDDYREEFHRIYGDEGISMHSVGSALAAYQRSLRAADSPVDVLLYGNGKEIASENNERLAKGLALFKGKARCASCHSIGERFALFTDQQLHNTGIGYARSMGDEEIFRTIMVAPGQALEVHRDDVGPNELDNFNDLGLYEITEEPSDRWKYRTPSLRNVGLTAPYMHNGALQTLEEVVRFYNLGGVPNPELDPLITPLNLSAEEQQSLVFFLENLTSPHVASLVEDARSTPIGERD